MSDGSISIDLGEGKGTLHFQGATTGERDVAARQHLFSAEDFDAIIQTIEGFADRLHTALSNAKPNRAAVEFGIEIGAESGKLTALIVKGSGSANLTIRLEWDLH